MQAIILAAGMGKRLGELTQYNTKCMIKIHGITLIERILAQLAKLSICRIVLVVGYKKELLKELIGNSFDSIPILYVENNCYESTNNIYSLYLVKDFLLTDDTIILESDLILSDNVIKKLYDNPYPNLAVVAKYKSWMNGTVVMLDNDNTILKFVSKKSFDFSLIDTYYKTVNVYKFSKDFSMTKYVPFLEAYCKALGNNEYYEQVLHVISLLDNSDLKACCLDNEKWYEIDDRQDFRIAEVLFSNTADSLELYNSQYGGYWRYPLLIDFCYLVNPFFPTTRMCEEIKNNFETLLSGYPSCIAENAALAASYLNINESQVVVGNGASELIAEYLREYPLKTGIIRPSFEEYANRLPSDLIYEFTPANSDFRYLAQDLIDYFDNKPIEQLILINPDNPSGNYLNKDEIELLINWSRIKGIKFLLDVSFIDFSKEPQRGFTLFDKSFLYRNPHLVVIKSISKSYGIPGLRLGFLVSGNIQLVDSIKSKIAIWNINSFAEFFLQIVGKYTIEFEDACRLFMAERQLFFSELQDIAYLRVIPSSANFFLCEVINSFTAKQLCIILLNKFNLYLKDCSGKKGFGNNQYVRIAIRKRIDNKHLISALKCLMKEQ